MKRAFTLIEMAICLTILSILVPIVYAALRGHMDHAAIAQWRLECADAARAVAEELRLDARQGAPRRGAEVVAFGGDCGGTYTVNADGALVREAPAGCGPPRALARRVTSIAWAPGGVEVAFARTLRPSVTHRDAVFIPVLGPKEGTP